MGCSGSAPCERTMLSAKQHGFSLIEMMIVVSIAMVMMGITFLTLQPAMKDARNNAAYNNALMQLRMARQRAIDNRQQFIVCFGTDIPKGASTPLGTPTAETISTF